MVLPKISLLNISPSVHRCISPFIVFVGQLFVFRKIQPKQSKAKKKYDWYPSYNIYKLHTQTGRKKINSTTLTSDCNNNNNKNSNTDIANRTETLLTIYTGTWPTSQWTSQKNLLYLLWLFIIIISVRMMKNIILTLRSYFMCSLRHKYIY